MCYINITNKELNIMKIFGVIYKLTNTINSKSYIGQTINFTKRMNEHRRSAINGEDYYLYRAMKKYGLDAFKIDIIIRCNNIAELNTFECYYINKYNTFNKHFGYNSTSGGGGCSGHKQSENTINSRVRKNNKAVLQYDLNGNFIKAWKSIRCAAEKLGLDRPNISNCCNGKKVKQVGGFVWRLKSDGFKKKLDINLIRNTLLKPKAVLQYDLDGDLIKGYSSITKASQDTGLSATLILNNCEGKTRLPKEFLWRYIDDPLEKQNVPEYIKRTPSKDNINKLKKAVSKPTIQYDLEGNFIKEYPSAMKAAKIIGIHYEGIYKVCRGKQKTAGGFKWGYK